MKKALLLTLLAVSLIAVLAIPAFACNSCGRPGVVHNDNDIIDVDDSLVWIWVGDKYVCVNKTDIDFDYDYRYEYDWSFEYEDESENNLELDLDDVEDFAGVVAAAYLNRPESDDKYGSRFDSISGNAFEATTGITTVQMAAGNANDQQSNVQITLCCEEDELGGTLAAAYTKMPESDECYGTRYDAIGGAAFADACGITTVQMSSGNANIQQSNVNISAPACIVSAL